MPEEFKVTSQQASELIRALTAPIVKGVFDTLSSSPLGVITLAFKDGKGQTLTIAFAVGEAESILRESLRSLGSAPLEVKDETNDA